MWLTDLLRKLSRGPNVGETFRHFIGCYLFGFEVEGQSRAEYITMPTNQPALVDDVRKYLQDFVQQHPNAAEVPLVQETLSDLPARIATHVAGDMHQPFLALPGIALFIRTGMRERRKANGKFIE